MRGILIRTDGEMSVVEINDFDHMKSLAGIDYAESIPFGQTGCDMYVDEEGKYKLMRPNPKATSLCRDFEVGLSPDDVIVGNAVILGLDTDGELASVNDDLIKKIIS